MRLAFWPALGCLMMTSALGGPFSAHAQTVPAEYQRFFVERADQRSRFEKALNLIGKTSFPVGRSFALIAGVTQYPNLPATEKSLPPAAVDISKLQAYLKDQEFFDEIVVLKDADMTLTNLNYFLENYFPERLAQSPHSRFLFAYSGHGYSVQIGTTTRGYLLTSAATSLTDTQNRVNLGVLRTILGPVIDSAEKVLVLVNSCDSGAFLGRKGFGPNPLGPGEKGAHAILASRPKQQSLHLDHVGPGSVFFEKLFTGLGGAADIAPPDGVITYHELDTYLHAEIPRATNGDQNPVEGDISPDGSVGEFFFLNRSRQISLGNAPRWNPESVVAFGPPAEDVLRQAQEAHRAETDDDEVKDLLLQAAEAGNTDAMNDLGYMYASESAGSWPVNAGEEFLRQLSKDDPDREQNAAENSRQARQWWEKAAAAGNADAMYNLGHMFDIGLAGVPGSYVEARRWYNKAAAAGVRDALYYLGTVYFDADLSERRMKGGKEARVWYEKAAVAGDSRGMYELAQMYYEGTGGSQDYQQAKQWFEKAAAAGHREAMYRLEDIYEKGQGVPRDPQKAQEWHEKAGVAALPKATGFLTHNF